MAKTIEDIRTAGSLHYIEVKEIEDGVENRRIITPDADVSNEDAQIQALASEYWTDAIKAEYQEIKTREEAYSAERHEIMKHQLDSDGVPIQPTQKIATLEATIASLEARLATLEG